MITHKTRWKISSAESLLEKSHSKLPKVKKYCLDVLSGSVPTGRLVSLAVERHLRDLERSKATGSVILWDQDDGLRAIEFFERFLCLAEGEHNGQPFKLEPWQQFIMASLFGWKSGEFRRFRTAYVEIGKGNGKSPMAAGIGLYGLLADRESAAEVYSAAVVKDQAKILFRDAENMRDASPLLKSKIEKHVNNLFVPSSNSFFRPISSEKRGLDGKRVHMALIDEIHEHPSALVVDKMRAGTKGRRQALIFEITNSGYDRNSVCYQHHDYSEKILSGIIENDSWFAYVCQLDVCEECADAGKVSPSCEKCDQWTDEAVWPKVNPNLGVSIQPKYLREQVVEAQGMPSKENIVKRLNFCMWTEQAVRWLPMDKWDACKGQVDKAMLAKAPCFAGLDLANTSDLAALVLVFPDGDGYKLLPYFWVPEETVRVRSEKERIPYDIWVREGFIKATEGSVIDYDVIRADINAIADEYSIQEIDLDPWNATQIRAQLEGDGFEVVEIRQGFQTLSAPTKELERLIRAQLLEHGGNPVLRWNASNVSVRTDPAGNLKPDKERSIEKIDGITALINALARAMTEPISSGRLMEII
jgi:phage terminase large subunit-like protein